MLKLLPNLLTYTLLTCTVVTSSSLALASEPHKLITQKLITLLANDAEVEKMLVSSLQKAKVANPDPHTNPAQNLEEYYDFIDSAVDLIPQVVLDNPKNLIRLTKHVLMGETLGIIGAQ